MEISKEIRRIIRLRKKENGKIEKTIYLYCKKCLGTVKTGTIKEIKDFEKEWHRQHNIHNITFIKRVLNKILFYFR